MASKFPAAERPIPMNPGRRFKTPANNANAGKGVEYG